MKNTSQKPNTLSFSLGQRVWYILDDEAEGIITGIMFRPNGVVYYVTWADRCESSHFESELTTDKAEASHVEE